MLSNSLRSVIRIDLTDSGLSLSRELLIILTFSPMIGIFESLCLQILIKYRAL